MNKIAIWGALALAGVVSAAELNPHTDMGRVMYIGDSITHGIAAPSYRWALHKIFVDNEVYYTPVGVERGNHAHFKGGLTGNVSYRGVPFENVHAAMSSQRAYETSGRNHVSKRLDGTDVFDWLGLDKSYDGPRKVKGAAPDWCFILLGTNDTLSDYGTKGGVAKHMAEAQNALTNKKDGDLQVIIRAVRRANPKAKVVLLPIPAWGDTRSNNSPEDYAAVVKYNAELPSRVKKVIFADVNEGLIDIACEEKPGRGVTSFFRAVPTDQLHPTQHGDLIIAGHVARALGLSGRTAGLHRKDGSNFARKMQKPRQLAPGEKISLPLHEGESTDEGFAVELQANVGDGSANGWVKDKGLALSVSDGVHSGLLRLSESYIIWGDSTILYPCSMDKKSLPAVRVAWLPGDEAQQVPAGFYVWFGDMLVGEALPDVPGVSSDGITLLNDGEQAAEVHALRADAAPSAPLPRPDAKRKKAN